MYLTQISCSYASQLGFLLAGGPTLKHQSTFTNANEKEGIMGWESKTRKRNRQHDNRNMLLLAIVMLSICAGYSIAGWQHFAAERDADTDQLCHTMTRVSLTRDADYLDHLRKVDQLRQEARRRAAKEVQP
jgi:hypothetical protein